MATKKDRFLVVTGTILVLLVVALGIQVALIVSTGDWGEYNEDETGITIEEDHDH